MENYEVVYDPLNVEKLELVIEKIAKYHALSKVLVQNGMEEITTFKMEFNEGMKAIFAPMLNLLASLAKVIQTWEGYKEIGDKLEAFVPHMFEASLKGMLRDNSAEFRVLNHGDFHLRNMMFKRSAEGELNEVLFLDFQMPQFNIPVFDLIGLINAMGDFGVRENQEEVLKLYHKKLVASLRLYGYTGDLPAFVDILIGMLRVSEHHAMYALLVGPMFSIKGMELGEFFNLEQSPELKEALNKLFNEENFKKNIQFAVKKFDKVGAFDIL